jgi:ribulose-phosphate 3-epimerase
MTKPRFAVAVNDIPQLALGDQVHALEAAGVDEWHVELSDGAFAPGPQGSVALVRQLAAESKLPVYVHLRMWKPEHLLEALATSGCKGVAVPIEACAHANRTLNQIRELGIEAGVSICAASPLTRLDYVLDLVSRVVVHASEPSSVGERYIETASERVRILGENLHYRESRAVLQATGHITTDNAARLHKLGAQVLTLGSAVFGDAPADEAAFFEFLEVFAEQRHLV